MNKQSATAVQKPAKNFREFEREHADVKKGEHVKAPLTRFSVRAGFNPRDLEKAETQEKIASLQAAYESGSFVPLIIVRMAMDGETAEIIDGECRYTAACLADKAMRERGGKGIEEFEAIRFTGTEAQARAMTITANSGEQLTPMEQADVVAWFQTEGFKRDEIAQHLGKGVSWIDRLIAFSKLPEEMKVKVRNNEVSADEAVKYVKKHGEEAAAKVQEKLDEAKAQGENKVTPKHNKAPEQKPDDQKPADTPAPDGDTPAPDGSTAESGGDTPPATGDAPTTQVGAQPNPERGQTLPPQAKSKESKEEKAERQRVQDQYKTARELAGSLPDKIKFPRNLADDAVHPLELSGHALKLLIALQKQFTPEIEQDLAAAKQQAA